MSPTQEIIDAEVVQSEITVYMGGIIEQCQALANAVNDDASANRAAELGVAIKTKIAWLKKKRFSDYEEHLLPATERIRLTFDNPLKLGIALEKTLSASIIKYQQDKKREEDRLRLAAEAEARRVREEAARKEREAEAERQRIIKEQQERERRRVEAEAAEERRVKAEAKAKEDAERARLKREQDERARLIKEEEDARLAQAQEAQNVGLGERVQDILETPKAIAPIATLPSKADMDAAAECQRQADAAEAEAERRRLAAKVEEDRLRAEEQERMRKLREDADKAKTDADLAEASAAAQASVTTADTRMRTNTSAKYEIADLASFLKLVKAVADGRAPVDWLGFDQEKPEKFRASGIGRHATKIKNLPDFAAKQAEAAAVGVRIWLEENGSFKSEAEAEAEA